MTKIYTRTGDDGTTGLIGGKRLPKDAPRIEAYGSVDELNALIGVVRSYDLPDRVDSLLRDIQDELFTVGADLALPDQADRERRGFPARPRRPSRRSKKQSMSSRRSTNRCANSFSPAAPVPELSCT